VKIYSDILKGVKDQDPITESDEFLISAMKDGDAESGYKLFVKHHRLVIEVIFEVTRGKWFSDDVFQAASVGLVEAARKFDPERNSKFTTYAWYWIKKYALLEACSEKLPICGIYINATIKDQLFRFLGLQITGMPLEDIAKKMRLPLEKVKELEKMGYSTNGQFDFNELGEDLNIEPSSFILEDLVTSESDNEFIDKLIVLVDEIDKVIPGAKLILDSQLGLNGEPELKPHQLAKKLKMNVPNLHKLKQDCYRELRKLLKERGIVK
jgi:RNA polymerase sigma factor (sigma-70 family)